MDKQLAIRGEETLSNLGEIFASSGYFQDAKQAAQAVVKILAGRELGLPPIASMTGIHIIKGKVSLSATTMAAVLKRHGDYDYKVLELDETQCQIEFLCGQESVGISTFTMGDAKQAGLLAQGNYKKYPRNMLFARAMSNGIRWYCPDILGGPAYTPGELEHKADEGAGDESPEVEVIEKNEIDIFAGELRQEDEAKELISQMQGDSSGPGEIIAKLNEDFPNKEWSISDVIGG